MLASRLWLGYVSEHLAGIFHYRSGRLYSHWSVPVVSGCLSSEWREPEVPLAMLVS